MRFDRFRSKGLVHFLIGAFLLLIMAESVPARAPGVGDEEKGPVVRVRANGNVSAAQQEKFETLMAEGKKLYDDMENDEALQKFNQARALAVTQRQKSDVYFYLSLIFYGMLEEGRSNEFTNAVNMLIEVDYYKQLDPQLCPQRYIEMYQEIKKNYGVLRVRSTPAGADVYINDDARSSGTTPLSIAALAGEVSLEVKKGKKKAKGTIAVVAGEETQSPEYELKGGSSTIYIIGGVLLAAGVGAAVALGGGGSEPSQGPDNQPLPSTTGTINVSSNPAGADVFLDGSDTGNATPTTLYNVSPGSHAVGLVKDGYLDFESSVNVTAGQTSTVNPELQRHVITIVTPDTDTVWMVGTFVEIGWETGIEGGLSSASTAGLGMNPMFLQRNVHVPTYRSETSRTNVSLPGQAAKGRNFRPSISLSRNRTSSKINLGSRGSRSPSRRVPFYRNPVASQGLGVPMKTNGAARVQALSAVKLDLYKGGTLNREITASTENDGIFEWTVPKALEDGQNYRIRISVASDAGIFFESPTFTILKEAPNIVTSKDEIGVFEGHQTIFQVKLSKQPASRVEITAKRVSGDQDIKIVSGGTLTFTTSNWNTYKKVTLSAAPDGDTQDGAAVFRLNGSGILPKDIDVTEIDLTEGPPKLISPADGSIFNHFPPTTTLRWEALPGVSGYRVEVEFYNGAIWVNMRNVVVTGTSYTFDFIGAVPGRWRVTARDGGGTLGPPSIWWDFSYTF